MFGRSIVFFSENKAAAGGGFSLSGGTETTVGSDKVLTFTTSGTLTVNGSGTVTVLVVGGGAGGGGGRPGIGASGAGGGGGEVIYTTYNVTTGSYTVTVGGQRTGYAANDETLNRPGNSSSIFTFTARGGDNANSWGAFGGGRRTSYNIGAGFDGQFGQSINITGTSVYYGSGAGGGALANTGSTLSGGSGGIGAGNGGGAVTNNLTPLATNGTNYGAGGGGGACIWNGNKAGDGATGQQGVVIVRYTPN